MTTMIQTPDEPAPSPTTARTVTLTLDVSESALQLVRAAFNPDHITEVGHVHLLAACFITICEKMNDEILNEQPGPPEDNVPARRLWRQLTDRARNAQKASDLIETACMYAVKAVTATYYKGY